MNLLAFLHDHHGKQSSFRVNSFLVVVTVLGLMVYCTVTGKTFPEVPNDLIFALLGAMGLQAFAKTKEAPPPKTKTE